MVYQKPDGTSGFSWQLQYDFLLREHPDNLEEIVSTKFMLLKEKEPDNAEYYEQLDEKLRNKINSTWDDDSNFGWNEGNKVVRTFIKDKKLEDMFSDVTALSSTNEQSDLSEDDELIAQYGFSNLEFVRDQEWSDDSLDAYLGKYLG